LAQNWRGQNNIFCRRFLGHKTAPLAPYHRLRSDFRFREKTSSSAPASIFTVVVLTAINFVARLLEEGFSGNSQPVNLGQASIPLPVFSFQEIRARFLGTFLIDFIRTCFIRAVYFSRTL
jgi:hypothetical protein